MRCVVAALACLSFASSALAIGGNAPRASTWVSRALVMVIDSDGDLCTGTALARDLVLTAAHCVMRPLTYIVLHERSGISIPVQTIMRHPQFDPDSYAENRATADLALIKLAALLPNAIVPAKLAIARRVKRGETLTIAGFGTVADGTARGLGVPRMARLTVTGRPGSLQIRLYDPHTRNQRAGLGACTGDSGAPAFDGDGPRIIGVVTWSTGPRNSEGCGGLTGLTPLLLYHDWIADTARKFNSPVKR